jgi:hypothetical protein
MFPLAHGHHQPLALGGCCWLTLLLLLLLLLRLL